MFVRLLHNPLVEVDQILSYAIRWVVLVKTIVPRHSNIMQCITPRSRLHGNFADDSNTTHEQMHHIIIRDE